MARSSRQLWAAKLQGKSVLPKTGLAQPVMPTPFRGRVMGIDPSLRGTGLACLDFRDSAAGRYLASETISPPATADLPVCLGYIAQAVNRFLDLWQPDVVAVEETIYVQNLRTAQKLGAARGAAIGAAAGRGFAVVEYPPLRIKQSVVGYGRASKEQVARQMRGLLSMQEELPFDEADAAAAAYCHAITRGRLQT